MTTSHIQLKIMTTDEHPERRRKPWPNPPATSG